MMLVAAQAALRWRRDAVGSTPSCMCQRERSTVLLSAFWWMIGMSIACIHNQHCSMWSSTK
jgi:hypothetical protein